MIKKAFRRLVLAVIVISMLHQGICAFGGETQGDRGPAFFQIHFSPAAVRQGDIITVKVNGPAGLTLLKGEFKNSPVFFDKKGTGEFTGLIGIDMTLSPGKHHLFLEGNLNGKEIKDNIPFYVEGRKYAVEKLTFPGKLVELDKETEERAEREAAILKSLWKEASSERLWSEAFSLPVDGNTKPNFGRRRILNGKEKSPHNGIDISAPEGKAVVSPNGGKVVLVGNHFFGGNTVVIDHGQGLFTAYLHLSEVLRREGEIVEKGEPIGKVGETGRSKGPHLHWSARLHEARVDPLKLLDLNTEEAPRASRVE